MYQEFYRGHALLGLPIFALLFFIALFTTAAVLTWRRSRTEAHRELSLMPFADEPSGERHV